MILVKILIKIMWDIKYPTAPQGVNLQKIFKCELFPKFALFNSIKRGNDKTFFYYILFWEINLINWHDSAVWCDNMRYSLPSNGYWTIFPKYIFKYTCSKAHKEHKRSFIPIIQCIHFLFSIQEVQKCVFKPVSDILYMLL